VRVALCAAGEIWGGVERFVSTFAPALHEAGVPVVVVLFHDAKLAADLRAAGVRVAVVEAGGKYGLRQVNDIERIFEAERCDVVHVHGYRATIAGALAARRRRIPVVKTEHGRLETTSDGGVSSRQLRMRVNLWLDRVATRGLVRAAAFVSDDLRKGARAALPPERTVVIPNAIAQRADARPSSRDQAFAPECFHIGIVGRVTAVKGHRYLIDAMARLHAIHDLRLHVIGSGPLEDACRQRCAAAGIADRVVFHGFRNDAAECLQYLDLVVMPSLQEGLPYALLEAMGEGRPIVASDLAGIREVMPDGRSDGGILVRPADAAALASAIEELYGDAPLRERLGRSAMRRCREAFLLEDMVTSYLQLYERSLPAAS
jgi:L-malate glycosyltransferase